MFDIADIISKTIETNEYVHYFAMKTIEFYADRIVILDIVVAFDGKFMILLICFFKERD